MIYLQNERLSVEIAGPGEGPNTGCRFDRSGFVTQVTLDGNCTFCASEPRNLSHRSTGGRGLCSEFKHDYSEEVKDGEQYPKLGVGLITRNGRYSFAENYEIEEFPVDWRASASRAEFHTGSNSCLGIAMEEWKEISIDRNRLIFNIKIKNIGEREICTDEYCHNFLSVDGMAVSSDYRLDLPDLKGLPEGAVQNKYPNEGNFISDGRGISLAGTSLQTSLADFPGGREFAEKPFRWTLSHKGSGAAVHAEDNLLPAKICLWSIDHIFSPEIIQTIAIQPGETAEWSRTYTFEQSER